MKNATFKTVLTCCAALALCQAAEAQRVTFEQNRDFRDQVGWPVHRGCPIVADFDNDGFMDVYYGGTSCENGWACRGVLARSNGMVLFLRIWKPSLTMRQRTKKSILWIRYGTKTVRMSCRIPYLTVRS